jgi:hypothetical protein
MDLGGDDEFARLSLQWYSLFPVTGEVPVKIGKGYGLYRSAP